VKNAWNNPNLKRAREMIQRANGGGAFKDLDPMAGGGLDPSGGAALGV